LKTRALISLRDVGFAYGARVALAHLDLDIFEGEFLGVIGPNSSGKSTLLRILSRSFMVSGRGELPWSGDIRLMDRALEEWDLKTLARTVACVSSEDHFVFPFTVEQVVLMGRTPYLSRWGKESDRDVAVAEESMRAVDVLHLRARAIDQLSSGERQRVLLARALAQEPKILLLDEPSAHLDVGHQWALFELLHDLHHQRGLTVVCVLHDLATARRHCSRLALLSQGTIRAIGAPSHILTSHHLQTVFGLPPDLFIERTLP